jgi:hypothetical protein
LSVCLFICKTKLKTLTEWTFSGPEGGIAITPVANTEYHPLLEGGGTTGCDTDLQALFDNDFELQNVLHANVPSNPVPSVQSMPVQFNSLMEANNRNVMLAVSNYNYAVHFNFYSK